MGTLTNEVGVWTGPWRTGWRLDRLGEAKGSPSTGWSPQWGSGTALRKRRGGERGVAWMGLLDPGAGWGRGWHAAPGRVLRAGGCRRRRQPAMSKVFRPRGAWFESQARHFLAVRLWEDNLILLVSSS